MMFDLLIRHGTIVDGTGERPYIGDVAVKDGRIAAIGATLEGDAHEVVDASGKLVTPGFIDPHTHYDGQATWDEDLLPSSANGVTTLVIGCCGIGFAPVRKGSEDWLIRLMEGVEDIPGTALHVGIPWNWETFPQYLDALSHRRFKSDIVAQVPHSTVRAYVLGKRAEEDAPATPDELARMGEIVRDSIAVGAVGLSTSRVTLHRASDGGVVPGTAAPEEELLALTRAMAEGGGGVLQIIPSGIAGGVEGEEGENVLAGMGHLRDKHSLTAEIAMMRRIHRATGQPITFSFAANAGLGVVEYEKARAIISEFAATGERIHPQISSRPTGFLMSLDSYNALNARPTYQALQHLPLPERAARMAEPETKAAILREEDLDPGTNDPFKNMHTTFQRNMDQIYDLGALDYEPDPSLSMAAQARAQSRDVLDVYYDALIADQGRAVLVWFSTGYADGDLRQVEECLTDTTYMLGLGDGGAHVQVICDASLPTFLLSHWGRDRRRGNTYPVELLVRRLSKDPADLYGLDDRGVLAEGRRADINVIDFDRLALARPRLVQDLPADAKRFLQDTSGYEMTILNGVVTRRHDEPTDAYPGRLVRPDRRQAEPTTSRQAADVSRTTSSVDA